MKINQKVENLVMNIIDLQYLGIIKRKSTYMTSTTSNKFDFEIDKSILYSHKEAIKIFGHDELITKKIVKFFYVIGGLLLAKYAFLIVLNILTLIIKHESGIPEPSILSILGLVILISGVYIKRNFKKAPLMIVYKDKILFRKQRIYAALPLLKIMDLFDLYKIGNYTSIQKADINSIVNDGNNLFDNKPIFFAKKSI